MSQPIRGIRLYRDAALVAAAVAGIAVGCRDVGPHGVRTVGDSTHTGPTPTGSTHVLLTDDPFPFYRVSRVDLYVVSVAVSLSADTGGPAGASSPMGLTNATTRARRASISTFHSSLFSGRK